MKKKICNFLMALLPAMSLGLVSCDPESGITPEVSVPDGYENYFIEDLSFSCSASETKVVFQINVDWSMDVVAPEGTSASWLSVDPATGDAGLHKIMVRVTENDVIEVRTAKIQLMSGKSKVAEILVTQERYIPEGAVDLGLSVLWASCNVGAESPTEYGDHFAWGETEEKSSYTSDNSLTYGLSISELESRGIIDSDGNLTAKYDAATANWGSAWRMPTWKELAELVNNCIWKWTTQNLVGGSNVEGYMVTGPNGNSIFLPKAGISCDTRDEDFPLGYYGPGADGDYWSATPCGDYGAFYHGFIGACGGWDSNSRYFGRSVRPVTELCH